ncbi:sodium:proton antiporter [Chloroflexi bacterium TSY]|nr:sodium:proton antiporter [Chloroflexi bacterium TSY]
MTSLAFTILAVGLLGFALISRRLERTIFTAPMIFTLYGLVLGPSMLGWMNIPIEHEGIHLLAEVTLMLVLFADATRIDLKLLRREHDLPLRMLSIGLPLTILFGAIVAWFFFGEHGIWASLVLATMLAPTDAALGQTVVTSQRVPVRIRQTLNVESGLNDGIVLPVLLILLSLAGATEEAQSFVDLVRFTLLQVTLGPLVGIAVGYLGGQLITYSVKQKGITDAFERLSALGLAILAFGAAELIGGNGFISAFVAGLTLGNSAPGIYEYLYEFAETEGQLLTLCVFTIFGGILTAEVIRQATVATILYALLSLTLIRMVPVAISLMGAGMRRETNLFLGWFGPRGLATVLFGLLVLDESHLVARDEITLVAMTTVLLSIFLHGITAYPLARLYADRADSLKHEELEEHVSVTEMPARVRMME